MTVRKKSTGEEFEIPFGKGTITFRTLLLVLVLSATPMGQQLLKNFGIQTPAQQDTGEMQKAVEVIRFDLAAVKQDIAGVKSDVSAVKLEVDKMKAQSERMQLELTGFRVDFDKYKASAPQTTIKPN